MPKRLVGRPDCKKECLRGLFLIDTVDGFASR